MNISLELLPPDQMLRKRKGLIRELLNSGKFVDIKVSILGSSTTSELVDLLELQLLNSGLRPTFQQADYNRYYEDTVLDSSALRAFQPDVVILHTSSGAIKQFPPLGATESDAERLLSEELSRYRSIWNAIIEHTAAIIIQNNFETPLIRLLGNLDAVNPGGRARFCNRLNEAFAVEACSQSRLLIHDQAGVASTMGLSRFLDPMRGFQYKITTTPEGSLALARSLAAIFRAIYGRSRKCLVLDLDNTLWGGVIGDDGKDHIRIGKETPEAEAFTDFQEYCLRLHDRGILLAVCSKNTDSIARQGFEHPDSVLKLDHFSNFKANWDPKFENIRAIARELNIGLDSLVFVDDNPAERTLVAGQLPEVAVPEVGSDVSQFIRIIEHHGYFESLSLSKEDLTRANQYAANAQRSELQSQFADYGEYLDSLKMEAEIDAFKPVYLDRITQLINKTNQFNLTTRRYTAAEVERISKDRSYVTLYGKLTDVFGDNGLISLIIARIEGLSLHVDTWLMSCRVLKRDMELAMLDALVEEGQDRGLREIIGTYIKSEKNGMVADHYRNLDFQRTHAEPDGSTSIWRLDLHAGYTPKNLHIRRAVYA